MNPAPTLPTSLPDDIELLETLGAGVPYELADVGDWFVIEATDTP